jgi:hypothetical protein
MTAIAQPFVYMLQPTPKVDEELEVFFNRIESDMGISSNYRASLGLAIPLGPDDVVEAAHRCRLILRALRAIKDSEAGVLRAAYTIAPWPSPLVEELGRLTGIVVRLSFVRARAGRSREELAEAEMLTRELGATGGASLKTLRREAEVRFVRAHRAYAMARGGRS